jgi:hypothetical protein
MKKAYLLIVPVLLALIFAGGLLLGFRLPAWLGLRGGPKYLPTANLIQQVQTLSQLVTVKYVLEKVVLLEDVKWYGESRVLLLAHGVVKAGVDLSELKPDDLEIAGQRIVLRLPPAQITDVYLDDTQTRVVERETGLLRAFDKNLEQSARHTALEEIRYAARRGGILKDANDRAREQLTALFRQLGYEQVEVQVASGRP